MRVTNRDSKRIGGIRSIHLSTGQLHLDHMLHLPFVCMAHADNRFLDRIRRIFTDLQTELGGVGRREAIAALCEAYAENPDRVLGDATPPEFR